MAKEKKLQGVILYDIELNGCLNGVYTNNYLHSEIFTETARVKKDTKVGSDGVSGEYDCFYFDVDNSKNICELIISESAHPNIIGTFEYSFVWKYEGAVIFRGVGYQMNERQIVVRYGGKDYE